MRTFQVAALRVAWAEEEVEEEEEEEIERSELPSEVALNIRWECGSAVMRKNSQWFGTA